MSKHPAGTLGEASAQAVKSKTEACRPRRPKSMCGSVRPRKKPVLSSTRSSRLKVSRETSMEAEHQMEGGLLLDVVVGERAAVLELLACEDEALRVGGDTLLVLDLELDHVDGVGGLDLKHSTSSVIAVSV